MAENRILVSSAAHESPNLLQRRTEYDAGGLPIYIGFAPMGEATSSKLWTIYKITYTNSLETLKQIGIGAWDDRSNGVVTYA